MNIVLISSLLIPKSIGGIEVFTMLLSHALTHEGHTVTIFTGGRGGIRKDEQVTIIEIPELQLPLHLKSFFMPYYAKRIQQRLAQEERIKKADIINAVDLDSIIALAGDHTISQKFIATIHDYGLVCANGLLLYGTQVCPNYCHCGKGFLCLKKRKLNIFQEMYLQIAYSIRKTYRDKQLGKIHNAICVSKFVAGQIAPIAPHIHTDIIGNCLPQTWWKEKHENTTKNIDILYPGRFESFKGIDVFIKALQMLPTKHPLSIYFVGGGKSSHYKKIISDLGLRHNITFIRNAPFEQMKSYYKRAKIVAVPSVWPEPCGRVIIEGMFWGAAVISTNQGGTPELITHGQTGMLVPAGNAKKLATMITKLLTNAALRKKISNQAASKASSAYTPYQITHQYETVYKRIAKFA